MLVEILIPSVLSVVHILVPPRESMHYLQIYWKDLKIGSGLNCLGNDYIHFISINSGKCKFFITDEIMPIPQKMSRMRDERISQTPVK